ncbi:hypothetical protein OG474_39905 [Kribbella sp. NBC_01505]|uniref:hypothetical protein n=1 Tax=Kribbella sp. NBC_01505 TaxID=2903580 RepID=UPI00386F8413
MPRYFSLTILEHMFEAEIASLSTADLLESAAGERAAEYRSAARSLVYAVVYADRFHPDVHPGRSGRRVGDGRERAVVLGGEGCPLVLEFCVAEYAAVVGVSPGVGRQYLADALGLRHRFPLLWVRVLAEEVTAWKARNLARECEKLSLEAALYVDKRVAHLLDTISPTRLAKIIKAAKMYADPGLAKSEADEKAAERGVWVGQSDEHGTKTCVIKAGSAAVRRHKAKIDEIAEALLVQGDKRSVQARRAEAVGIMPDPVFTNELLAQAREHQRTTSTPAPAPTPASAPATATAPAPTAGPAPAPDPASTSDSGPTSGADSAPVPAPPARFTPASDGSGRSAITPSPNPTALPDLAHARNSASLSDLAPASGAAPVLDPAPASGTAPVPGPALAVGQARALGRTPMSGITPSPDLAQALDSAAPSDPASVLGSACVAGVAAVSGAAPVSDRTSIAGSAAASGMRMLDVATGPNPTPARICAPALDLAYARTAASMSGLAPVMGATAVVGVTPVLGPAPTTGLVAAPNLTPASDLASAQDFAPRRADGAAPMVGPGRVGADGPAPTSCPGLERAGASASLPDPEPASLLDPEPASVSAPAPAAASGRDPATDDVATGNDPRAEWVDDASADLGCQGEPIRGAERSRNDLLGVDDEPRLHGELKVDGEPWLDEELGTGGGLGMGDELGLRGESGLHGELRVDGEPWLREELGTDGEPGLDDEADRDAPHPSTSDLPDPLDQCDGWATEPFEAVGGGDDSEAGESMTPDELRALAARLAQVKRDAHARPQGERPAPPRPGKTEVYVHLTDYTLASGDGVLRTEEIGPLLLSQFTELTGYGPYIVKPVIDLNKAVSSDAYESTGQIREHVKLTHPAELFPYGTRETTNHIDQDHLEAYDPDGPPGQTNTDNLIPLSRYAHRVKTHASGWTVHRIDAKTIEWTTPHGFIFRIDPTGTHRMPKDPTKPVTRRQGNRDDAPRGER